MRHEPVLLRWLGRAIDASVATAGAVVIWRLTLPPAAEAVAVFVVV